jgi:hypothetical protein
MRNIARHVARCGDYEFEDVITGCDDTDVVAPYPATPVANRIVRHAGRMLGRERLTDGADPKQIACLVAELQAQPQRLAQIRRNNVTNSLRRHDWAYRWRETLDHVGLSVTESLVEREAQLNSTASLVSADSSLPRAS